jgi:hypothetical protein
MSTANRLLLFAAAATAFAALAAPAGEKPPAAEVELKPIKYDTLKAAVRGQRGKVVVVDFWAEY